MNDYDLVQELPGQKLHMAPDCNGRLSDVAICGRNNHKTSAWQRPLAFASVSLANANAVESGLICRNCLRVQAARQKSNWGIYDCTEGDFSIIPPLPDAGPEPVWHQKELKYYLTNMHIDEALWEELALLEHVTEDYLQEVYRQKYNRHPFLRGEELVAFIRENRPFEVVPVPEEDDDDDDEEDDIDF